MWAGNGSNEVLLHLLQAFGGPGRTALGFTPAYSMHPIITRTVGTTWVDGLRGVQGGGVFDLGPEGVAAQVAAHRPHLVFLCSPNNPTGTSLGLDVVRAAYDGGPGRDRRRRRGLCRVRPPRHPERPDPARGRERLVVTRTMSKAFALAGGRLGYLAATPGSVTPCAWSACPTTCPRPPRRWRGRRWPTPAPCWRRSR